MERRGRRKEKEGHAMPPANTSHTDSAEEEEEEGLLVGVLCEMD